MIGYSAPNELVSEPAIEAPPPICKTPPDSTTNKPVLEVDCRRFLMVPAFMSRRPPDWILISTASAFDFPSILAISVATAGSMSRTSEPVPLIVKEGELDDPLKKNLAPFKTTSQESMTIGPSRVSEVSAPVKV